MLDEVKATMKRRNPKRRITGTFVISFLERGRRPICLTGLVLSMNRPLPKETPPLLGLSVLIAKTVKIDATSVDTFEGLVAIAAVEPRIAALGAKGSQGWSCGSL